MTMMKKRQVLKIVIKLLLVIQIINVVLSQEKMMKVKIIKNAMHIKKVK